MLQNLGLTSMRRLLSAKTNAPMEKYVNLKAHKKKKEIQYIFK